MDSYWYYVVLAGGINAIHAWALCLAVRSGQLSVGHAALAGVGGYLAGYSIVHGSSIFTSVLVAILASAAVGLALCLFTLRLNHLFFALATLIFGQICTIVAMNTDIVGGAAGLAGIPLMDIGPTVLITVVVILVVEVIVLRGSGIELRMRILAQDPTLLEMAGQSATLLRAGVFTVSAAVAGFAGALSAFEIGVMQPNDLGFTQSLNFLVFAVVGGSTGGVGALLGGFVLTVLPELLGLQGVQSQVLHGFLLLTVMLVLRDGIVPRIAVRILPKKRLASSDTNSPPKVE